VTWCAWRAWDGVARPGTLGAGLVVEKIAGSRSAWIGIGAVSGSARNRDIRSICRPAIRAAVALSNGTPCRRGAAPVISAWKIGVSALLSAWKIGVSFGYSGRAVTSGDLPVSTMSLNLRDAGCAMNDGWYRQAR
jgi:hypothetical protein